MTAFSSSICATVDPSLLCRSSLCRSSLYAAAFFLHIQEALKGLPSRQWKHEAECFLKRPVQQRL